MRIPEPVLNEDFYMVKLIGGDVTLPTPRTRLEELLYIYAGGTIERPTPKTVEERFLDYITGGESELPVPKTRLQSYMYNVANPLNKIPIVPPKTRFECYWFEMATANYLENVQKIVRNGTANKIFPIRTKMYCHRDDDTLEWDVIGIDHDTPADSRFTHSMTLQLHDCFPKVMQFDAAEAFYYCETELPAGTYHFTIDSTYDVAHNDLSSYQFTLGQAVPEGGQLTFPWGYNVNASTVKVNSFESATSTTTIEQVAVSEGTGGRNLGKLTVAGDFTNNLNSIHRVRYGSNNYKESAIRQWLNSTAEAGSVWAPQTKFDRPPEWHTGNKAIAGFMNGMDADFLAAIGKTHIVVARNNACDGGGYDEMDDYFFLLSRSEVYGGVEVSGVNEGTAYPYYSDYSSLSAAGIGNDSNRIKYRSGSLQSWWTRTPNSESGSVVRDVITSGAVSATGTNGGYGVALACNVI